MYGSRFVLLIVLLLAVAPGVASAQPEEDPRKTAKAHAGVFYITPSLALVNFGVDTNVFNQPADEKQQDFSFTVRPGADVWVPFAHRAMIITNAAVDLVYFQTFSSERSADPYVRVRPEFYFNRLTLFAEGSYLDTRQRPSYEIDVRARQTQKEAKGGFNLRLMPKFSIELAGRERRIRFDADQYYEGTDLQQTLNRDERALSATARYRWTPLTTVVLLTEAESDRFIYSPVRNTDSVRIMPGVQLRPRAIVSGNVYVGYRRFVGLSDELPDFSGLVATGRLTYILFGATEFTFTADRDVQYSYEPAQPYYVDTGFGLNARHALSSKFDVEAGYQRYQYAYEDLLTPGASARASPALPQRIDLTQNASFSVGYRASRDMRIGLGASYWERTSNTRNSRDYNGLRIGLRVEYGLPR